jgi:hypothetical protein
MTGLTQKKQGGKSITDLMPALNGGPYALTPAQLGGSAALMPALNGGNYPLNPAVLGGSADLMPTAQLGGDAANYALTTYGNGSQQHAGQTGNVIAGNAPTCGSMAGGKRRKRIYGMAPRGKRPQTAYGRRATRGKRGHNKRITRSRSRSSLRSRLVGIFSPGIRKK